MTDVQKTEVERNRTKNFSTIFSLSSGNRSFYTITR